ncbi:hypothetical protein [Mesorhizobium australafricanum]|uniref:Uncharacterized protein n=1 Tax=Mesorhizobium australafricanum TaxID=3072311 RepID=A0ABU4X6F4_9HYPH|nr:hypothetical protein [Mesorhizobium sp. VK3E]MDX8443878.1 hypothetical protein [Mesorhizobium sp. VK3E]
MRNLMGEGSKQSRAGFRADFQLRPSEAELWNVEGRRYVDLAGGMGAENRKASLEFHQY